MPNFAFFDQLEQKINILMTDKKYRDAFILCKDCILKYPEENKFSKLKNQIERAVMEQNEKVIKDKLDTLKPLWKEEKYAEILKNLKELLRIDANSSKLKNLYQEAEIAYRKQFERLKTEFNKRQNKRLAELLNNHPDQLIEELFILEKENPNNQNVSILVADFRNKLIAKKIKDKEQLLNSEKYEDIDHFIQELLKIDKLNKQIQEVSQRVKARKFESAITQTKEFVYSGGKYLDTLMKLEKYDKVIKVASEVLQVDKNDRYARKILNTAIRKYSNQLKNLAADSIIKNFQNLKAEYLQDKGKFIRL